MVDTAQLVRMLMPLDPEKIILFGSYAKKTQKPESDVDVLIVKKTKKKPAQRIREALALVWGRIPHIEPQVVTPEEFRQAVTQRHSFIQEVIKDGVVLYEKKN